MLSVDINTGASPVVFNNSFTQFTGSGANGFKYQDRNVYFTNAQRRMPAKIAVDTDGNLSGESSITARGDLIPDDFAFHACENAHIFPQS